MIFEAGVETVDVVKVMFRPGVMPTEGAALEEMIEKAAIRVMIKHFGQWIIARHKPMRVDVLEYSPAPPYKVLFQRWIVLGKLRRMT